MKKAWITGAGGLIGSYLAQTAKMHAPGWEVLPLTRRELELEDEPAVRALFAQTKPDVVIHCAGLTQSGPCQENPELARRLNVEVTRRLCALTAGIRFFFFSTDLVFDGRKGNYTEEDAVNPLMVYAQTKVAAEEVVLGNPNHTVIRAGLNGGVSPKGNRGFNEELNLAWAAGKTAKLFVDEFRSPIPAAITARAVWELVLQDAAGLYHLGGSERLSRWEIGCLVAKRWAQLEARMERETIKNFKGLPRPADVSMDCAKIRSLLSFRIPGLAEWLEQNPKALF
ncbi:MAG TPA: SDR family oxidoreductase [Candidatus Saccharimonadales bacterium]|nr:SDR family oxidoreductase [Candidatus Saccharimonadales bacterium]